MSRLIVKGIPKYFSEDNLRLHFSTEGHVTDVRLMKKRNGESRQFAFIGYKSKAEAEKAAKYFNALYINTSKIDVEVAKTFTDPSVPQAVRQRKREAEFRLRQQEERLLREQEEIAQRKKQKKHSKIDDEIEQNPKLKEFIEATKPASKTQSWKDLLADGLGAPGTKELEEALGETNEGSDDEYEDLNPVEESETEEFMPLSEVKDFEEKQDGSIARDENVSDLDWLKQRQTRIRGDGEKVVKETKTEKQREAVPDFKEETVSEEQLVADKIRETARLFIRNIHYESTEDEFRELFQDFGPLEEVHIALDTRTGKSKGFVYIQFRNPADAVAAYNELDKQIFQGRLLHIMAADAKKDHRLDEFAIKNLPLKKQRELQKKSTANKNQFNWNALYMNNDAVLDSVASKMGITKAQLIDPENSASAVKQALAEADVIGSVRRYFEQHGVDLTQFSHKERDDKIILVKNFPYGTSPDELGELFTEYGQLNRILMPPAGTIAIVEFRDQTSARAAFTKLAYRMFKKSILYLEKGPKGLFLREPKAEEAVSEPAAKEVEAKVTAADVLANDEEEEVSGPTVSVFVKNLNFSTTSQTLSGLFQSLPGYVVALVKTKPNPKGGVLSMGFGFVEFKSKGDAERAIAAYDGHSLEGRKIQLKLSHRKGEQAKAARLSKSSKIIIKNLPFEATRRDVLELFSAFGQVKSVRVPKKFDKSARGFAFVEFTLLKEAESAMNQLEGVHLLGRRMVMQYAQQDAEDAEEEIERMTSKAKKQAASREMAAMRLAGKGKVTLEGEDPFDEFA